MSRGIPWTVQPPAGTGIDWSNPLTRGLRDVIEFYGVPRSKLLGTTPTFFGTTPKLGVVGPQGISADTRAAYGCVYFTGANSQYSAAQQTHLFIGSLNSAGNSYCSIGSVAPGPVNSLALQWNGGSSWGAAGASSVNLTFSIPLGERLALGISGDSSGSVVYSNGVQVGVAAAVVPQLAAGAGLCVLGQEFNSVLRAIEGTTALQLMFVRSLSAAEHFTLSRNPWQIFQPRRQRFYSIPSTTSGATGTAALTEASDSVSATGALSVAGTASIAEGADTSAGTGNTGDAATAAITEQPDVVAGTGALSVAGTAAITEGADTSAGTGATGDAGTAAITEGDDTVSATGALSVAGTASIAEAADTASASGTVGTGATASITDAPDAVAGVGALSVSGAGAIFEAGDIVVSSGAAGSGATAAITDAPDTVSATGGITIPGSASIADEPDTVVAVGGIAITGIGAAADALDIVVATGTLGLIGQALITEGADTAYGTSTAPPQAACTLGGVISNRSSVSVTATRSAVSVIASL